MSETVHYKGTATKIYQDLGKTVEEMAQQILLNRGFDSKPSWADNYIEALCEMFSNEFFYHPKSMSLYKVDRWEHEQDEEIIKANKIGTDKFEFELRYYNGGAGFGECLEEALDEVV
jgi:hypothetical protein